MTDTSTLNTKQHVLDLDTLSPEDRRRFEGLGAEVIEADGHQLLHLSRLWQWSAPNASLVLGSRVLDVVEASRHLRVRAEPDTDLEWIPGRLALRWMVEGSGFDVLRWLPEETVARPSAGPVAFLAARRSERVPVFLEQPEPSRVRSVEDRDGARCIEMDGELDPIGLLARLRESTAPGGRLVLRSTMLADPTMAEHVRCLPRGHDGDRGWLWVPGPLALSTIVEAAGFAVEGRFEETPGPPGELDTVSGSLRATPR